MIINYGVFFGYTFAVVID